MSQDKAATRSKSAEKRAQKEWERNLLTRQEAATLLGLGLTLFEAFCKDHRITPALIVGFKKWGKQLETPKFDPNTLNTFVSEVEAWKHMRKTAQKTNRKPKTASTAPNLPASYTHLAPRTIFFHCGPTNSGKTWACFEALRKARTGIYAAPLRLLALEAYQTLSKSRTCQLITGEERLGSPKSDLLSCTIESLNTHTHVDVAVLDEIQMLADPARGWAWTQAFFTTRAKVLYLAGSIEALPWIKALVKQTNDTLHIVPFERKAPLSLIPKPVTKAQPGDAIIVFSRNAALDLRAELQSYGIPVSLIHGGLPPEVRLAEAERFQTGEAEVLVATDAIGMGLNLPIQRILFTTLEKFDGKKNRPLTHEEIRQIAGRAGRWGQFQEGFVGCWNLHPPAYLGTALKPPDPSAKRPKPWWRPLDILNNTQHLEKSLHQLRKAYTHPQFPLKLALDDSLIARAHLIDAFTLNGEDAQNLLNTPADLNDDTSWGNFLDLLKAWKHNRTLSIPNTPKRITSRRDLTSYDGWTKHMVMLRWVDRHWPNRFFASTDLQNAWTTGVAKLQHALANTDNAFTKACSICGTSLPIGTRFGRCSDCHQTMRGHYHEYYEDY